MWKLQNPRLGWWGRWCRWWSPWSRRTIKIDEGSRLVAPSIIQLSYATPLSSTSDSLPKLPVLEGPSSNQSTSKKRRISSRLTRGGTFKRGGASRRGGENLFYQDYTPWFPKFIICAHYLSCLTHYFWQGAFKGGGLHFLGAYPLPLPQFISPLGLYFKSESFS